MIRHDRRGCHCVNTRFFPLEMSPVRYPERAIVKQSNQLQSPVCQNSTKHHDNLDDRALRDLLFRKSQHRTKYQWFPDLYAIFFPSIPRSFHPYSLPLYCIVPLPADPVNSVVDNTTTRCRQTLCTPKQSTLSQSKIEDTGGRRIQQGSPTSRTTFRRRINIRPPAKEKQERRKKEILEILSPILPTEQIDSQRILLCWGKPDQCQITAVEIPLLAEGDTVWNLIKEAWYKQTKVWRRALSSFRVIRVSVVNVSG